MRIGLLIRDTEYRKALSDRIADYDSDIILDVIGASSSIERDALILTDAKPAELSSELTDKIRDRTVFLTAHEHRPSTQSNYSNHSDQCNLNNLYFVFKYESVGRLLAQITDIYSKWRGIGSHKSAGSKVIACCTDSDAFSAGRCTALASQIIYMHGGRIIIIPLGYINEDSCDYGRDINRFARLMYMVKSGRYFDALSVSYADSYGIYRLMMPRGRNPVAYLEEDDLCSLITAMSNIFDTVILDIAGCYRKENLNAIRNADSVICFETGRKRMSFTNLPVREEPGQGPGRLKVIKADTDADEAYALDEYIRNLYGAGNGK